MKLLKASLFALVWMILTTFPALAQEDSTGAIFCGDLTPADCAQFTLAAEFMESVSSGISIRQTEISLSGMPVNGALRFANQISFVADPAIVARIQELTAMDTDDLVNDPELLRETIMLPLQMDYEQINMVEFSPELSTALSAQFGINVPAEIVYTTRLIDGVIYIRVADFAGFVPQITALGDWIGIQMDAFMPAIIEQAVADTLAQLETDASQMPPVEIAPPPGVMMGGVIYTEIETPDQPPLLAEYLNLYVVGSEEVEGQMATVYRMHVNTPRYFASPLFAERLGAFLQGDGEGRPVPNPLITSVAVLGSVLFNGLDIRVTQVVGQETPYLFDTETRIHWQLNPFGRTVDSPAGPTIDVTMGITNQQLNQLDAIPVPESAFVPPLRIIMDMVNSLQ